MPLHTECYSLVLTNLLLLVQWCILLGWFALNQSTNISQTLGQPVLDDEQCLVPLAVLVVLPIISDCPLHENAPVVHLS